MNNYRDVLWVEDFDSGDTSRLEEKIKDCYSEDYAFRVYAEDKMKMLALLQALEDEKEFLKYSCVVLDINLNKAFGGADKEKEFQAIKEILAKKQVRILDKHDPDEEAEDYSEFRINAGYYVYLYLVQRGMPASRICMLTGNKGENSLTEGGKNLTEGWEEIFEDAGLIPPKSFDKSYELKEFHDWLKNTLTPASRLRSCIIGMSFYAEKILEDEILKVHLQNLYRIPLRLSEDTKIASPEFISALWQIVQSWESHTDDTNCERRTPVHHRLKYAYQMTLKTTRNWFAHRCLEKMSLLTTAFLFGIGLRGLLGEKLREKLNRGADEIFKEYKRWENELIALIEELDKDKPSAGKKETGEIVIKSCQEFFTRIKTNKVEITTDICSFIQQNIGQKKDNKDIREEDLLRDFLHGVYPINWRGDGKIYPNHALGIVFDFDNEFSERLKHSAETRYLRAVKNTLVQAIG